MDDLEQRLNSILSDPESLSRLTELAGGILGSQNKEEKSSEPAHNQTDGNSGMNIDPAALARISGILYNMRDDSEDSRLLLALKPYLKDKRKEKVDETVKLMKLMKLAPILKDLKL